MNKKILLFDIGNTSIKIGIACKDSVLTTYSLPQSISQTSDNLGLYLKMLLHDYGMSKEDLQAILCSSVVPSLTPLVQEGCKRFLDAPFYQVPHDISVPLNNCYSKPQEVGSDRLVCSYAARTLFQSVPSLIVVDFGTATTFDCVSGHDYLGGIIFPGVYTSFAALSTNAAKLPRIDLETHDTEPVPGRDTASSMQHGMLFGFAALVEGLSARLAKQLNGEAHIIGTGGFAAAIAKVSTCFHSVIPNLTLEGLRKLYFENEREHIHKH